MSPPAHEQRPVDAQRPAEARPARRTGGGIAEAAAAARAAEAEAVAGVPAPMARPTGAHGPAATGGAAPVTTAAPQETVRQAATPRPQATPRPEAIPRPETAPPRTAATPWPPTPPGAPALAGAAATSPVADAPPTTRTEPALPHPLPPPEQPAQRFAPGPDVFSRGALFGQENAEPLLRAIPSGDAPAARPLVGRAAGAPLAVSLVRVALRSCADLRRYRGRSLLAAVRRTWRGCSRCWQALPRPCPLGRRLRLRRCPKSPRSARGWPLLARSRSPIRRPSPGSTPSAPISTSGGLPWRRAAPPHGTATEFLGRTDAGRRIERRGGRRRHPDRAAASESGRAALAKVTRRSHRRWPRELKAGDAALAAGHQEVASQAYALARRIDPNSQRAVDGTPAGRLLKGVLPLLKDAQKSGVGAQLFARGAGLQPGAGAGSRQRRWRRRGWHAPTQLSATTITRARWARVSPLSAPGGSPKLTPISNRRSTSGRRATEADRGTAASQRGDAGGPYRGAAPAGGAPRGAGALASGRGGL